MVYVFCVRRTLPALALSLGLIAGCATTAGGRPATPAAVPSVTVLIGTVTSPAATAPAPSATAASTTSTGTPPAASTASVPAPSPTVRPTAAAAGNVGYLEGHADIGPLRPVEREGEPAPTPSAATCTPRGLAIYQADGTTAVTSFDLQPDCTYHIALPAGTYVVRLKRELGIGGSKDLPATIAIEAGKTLRLDISIDTGIR